MKKYHFLTMLHAKIEIYFKELLSYYLGSLWHYLPTNPDFPTSTLSSYNFVNILNFFMKFEMHTRLTINNTITLKFLGNSISNKSFCEQIPALHCVNRKGI